MADQNTSKRRQGLMNAISGPESAGQYDRRYHPTGVRRFSNFTQHPNIGERIAAGPNAGRLSTAAGKYQITKTTYDHFAKQLGVTDFSPETQDALGWAIAKEAYSRVTGEDLDTALANGEIGKISKALAGTWTSLPGGIENQLGVEAFKNAYAKELAAVNGVETPMARPPGLGLNPNVQVAEAPAAAPAEHVAFQDAPTDMAHPATEKSRFNPISEAYARPSMVAPRVVGIPNVVRPHYVNPAAMPSAAIPGSVAAPLSSAFARAAAAPAAAPRYSNPALQSALQRAAATHPQAIRDRVSAAHAPFSSAINHTKPTVSGRPSTSQAEGGSIGSTGSSKSSVSSKQAANRVNTAHANANPKSIASRVGQAHALASSPKTTAKRVAVAHNTISNYQNSEGFSKAPASAGLPSVQADTTTGMGFGAYSPGSEFGNFSNENAVSVKPRVAPATPKVVTYKTVQVPVAPAVPRVVTLPAKVIAAASAARSPASLNFTAGAKSAGSFARAMGRQQQNIRAGYAANDPNGPGGLGSKPSSKSSSSKSGGMGGSSGGGGSRGGNNGSGYGNGGSSSRSGGGSGGGGTASNRGKGRGTGKGAW